SKFQLFEEFTNTPISITSRLCTAGAELIEANRTIRTGIAEHNQLIVHDTNFHRFTFVVSPVINSIDQCFFNGVKGKVLNASRFRAPMMLNDDLADVVASNVVQCFACHAGQRSFEYLLGKLVTARSRRRKPDDVNLHNREKALRLGTEHHETDIKREGR